MKRSWAGEFEGGGDVMVGNRVSKIISVQFVSSLKSIVLS
jgi:hypothetical protein